MELRQLEYFQMASRLRNITRAAERLRVSQPNITVAIKKLEAELGIQLFDRSQKQLALTPEGCADLAGRRLRCRVLLAPGGCRVPEGAGTVVTCGLSPRDSLTLSSLAEPVLCIQRALPRLDGSILEPQEVPLPPLPAPAEGLLPLLGLWLLQMPLTNALSHGTLSPKGGERR